MIAVIHERIDDEVEQFNNGFWSGDVYFDEKKEFYNALGYVLPIPRELQNYRYHSNVVARFAEVER